jgi:hypothetical protein
MTCIEGRAGRGYREMSVSPQAPNAAVCLLICIDWHQQRPWYVIW